jgi:tRNA nucleotidyltransferase (CCA-adding enzyme)
MLQYFQLLGAERCGVIAHFARVAGSFGTRLYLVGGCVRDLLLGYEVSDLDLMVEDGLSEVLGELAERYHDFSTVEPKVLRFERYFTAKLSFTTHSGEQLRVDLSQARAESYSSSGAKPEVRAGTLTDDLRRRDFTVNSLALLIEKGGISLVDLVRGQEDLSSGTLRVHHRASFQDDPIRLVRAVRFIDRFGFKFDEETERLFHEAVGKNLLLNVSVRRRFDEVLKVLSEREPLAILRRLDQLSVLRMLCPFVASERVHSISATDSWEDLLSALLIRDDLSALRGYFDEIQLERSLRERLL